MHSEDRFVNVDTRGTVITTVLFGGETYLGTESGQVLRVRHFATERQLEAEPVLRDPFRVESGGPQAVTGLLEADGKLLN